MYENTVAQCFEQHLQKYTVYHSSSLHAIKKIIWFIFQCITCEFLLEYINSLLILKKLSSKYTKI